MKTWILALAMMAGMTMNAQHGERRHEGKKHGREQMEQFTPEQQAELQTKKLTLELDLTEKQQADIKTYFTQKNKELKAMKADAKAKREAGKKPTADERFAIQNKRLDDKIATKAFFKKTLDARQISCIGKDENGKKGKNHKKTRKFEKEA